MSDSDIVVDKRKRYWTGFKKTKPKNIDESVTFDYIAAMFKRFSNAELNWKVLVKVIYEWFQTHDVNKWKNIWKEPNSFITDISRVYCKAEEVPKHEQSGRRRRIKDNIFIYKDDFKKGYALKVFAWLVYDLKANKPRSDADKKIALGHDVYDVATNDDFKDIVGKQLVVPADCVIDPKQFDVKPVNLVTEEDDPSQSQEFRLPGVDPKTASEIEMLNKMYEIRDLRFEEENLVREMVHNSQKGNEKVEKLQTDLAKCQSLLDAAVEKELTKKKVEECLGKNYEYAVFAEECADVYAEAVVNKELSAEERKFASRKFLEFLFKKRIELGFILRKDNEESDDKENPEQVAEVDDDDEEIDDQENESEKDGVVTAFRPSED